MARPSHLSFGAALLVVAFPSLACALDATDNYITTITTATVSTPGVAGSTSDGYYFDNLDQAIAGFNTAAGSYVVGATADNVAVRRNTVNNAQSSVWYTDSGVTSAGNTTGQTDLSGVHAGNYGNLLLGNNIYGGSDNTFANGTSSQTGNIERLDFSWNTPLVSGSSLAFAVFDRGAVGVHDSFAIAAITGVDGNGKPTAFSPLLKVAAGWGAAVNPIADQNYKLFRYGNGDNIGAANPNPSVEGSTQGIGGIVIKASDLGVADGTLIYGYALMATDVTATNSDDLVDWTKGAFYPTTTDGNTGGGGIDLAAVNGIAFTLVPEPGTWTLLLLGIGLLVVASRRTRIVSLGVSR